MALPQCFDKDVFVCCARPLASTPLILQNEKSVI